MLAPRDHHRFWTRHARRVARRHRIARSLELFLPALTACCAAGAAALLIARSMQAPHERIWIAMGAAAVITAAGTWFLAHRRLSFAQALVRLEEQGHLHNRLTTASQGIGAWPEPRVVPDGVRWNWRRLFTPLIVAALLLAGARWAPLPEAASTGPREEPMAWAQVESWLETMKEAKVIEPESLEKIEARLEELRNQPPEKWYQQSSLEAGDSLRQQTEAALRGLQRDLHEAERVATAAERSGPGTPKDELKKMDGAWQQTLQGLAGGDLPLNKELLQQAKEFQPGAEHQLSPEEMAQLRERLEEGSKVCEQCVGPSSPPTAGNAREVQAGGGEGGGGETAPLSWKKRPTPLEGKEREKLTNDDLTRALPAETLAVTSAEHEVKKEAPVKVAGGEIAGPGQGGAAVWREAMVPREREVLQRFFK